jgi:uncharacterized protein
MPDPLSPGVTLAVYNVVQNTVLPQTAYVPTNLLVASVLVAQARSRGSSWDELGLDLRDWRLSVRTGVVAVGIVVIAMAVASQVPGLRAYLIDERARGHLRKEVLFRSLIRFPLGTALFEEVAFRGVLYGSWRRQGSSPARAAVMTGASFGAWHLLPGRTALAGNPLQQLFRSRKATATAVAAGTVMTGVSSLLLTRLRNRTGSLLAPWLVHAGVNSVGYLAGVAAWDRHAKTAPR